METKEEEILDSILQTHSKNDMSGAYSLYSKFGHYGEFSEEEIDLTKPAFIMTIDYNDITVAVVYHRINGSEMSIEKMKDIRIASSMSMLYFLTRYGLVVMKNNVTNRELQGPYKFIL